MALRALIQFAVGCVFEDPGDLGEWIYPHVGSWSSATVASCLSWPARVSGHGAASPVELSDEDTAGVGGSYGQPMGRRPLVVCEQ
jgi:hypothetical protein